MPPKVSELENYQREKFNNFSSCFYPHVIHSISDLSNENSSRA